MVEIRVAVVEDLPLILHVASMFIEEAGYINPAALREGINRGTVLIHPESGSFIHYRIRQDLVTTAYEMAVPLPFQGKGIGRALMEAVPAPIEFRCPYDNASNRFVERMGARLLRVEKGKSRRLNVWRIDREGPPPPAPLAPTPLFGD